MLRFIDFLIPGTSSNVAYGSSNAARKRVHHFGLLGDTEIRGYRGGRELRASVWIHDPKWNDEQTVHKWLSDLDRQINKHGNLHVLDRDKKILRTFAQVTFDDWQPASLADGFPMSPIPDVAGCLEPSASKTVYWMELNLQFYQLITPLTQH